jgi:hypothetical protein
VRPSSSQQAQQPRRVDLICRVDLLRMISLLLSLPPGVFSCWRLIAGWVVSCQLLCLIELKNDLL